MRLVIQRVCHASVWVADTRVAAIGRGLLVLVGIARGDTPAAAEALAGKTARLRVFEDERGLMNLSAQDTGAEVLAVSQFTLYGDCRRGNRPSFTSAAPPEEALPLYQAYLDALRRQGLTVHSGRFGARMQVQLENDGPVTLLLEGQANRA